MDSQNFSQGYDLINNIKAALDDLVAADRAIESEGTPGQNSQLISGALGADSAIAEMNLRMYVRRLCALVFPEDNFENVPEVWDEPDREMNKFVERARANVEEKSRAYDANPTPANKIMLDNAIGIERKWDELKFKTFYGGDESTD